MKVVFVGLNCSFTPGMTYQDNMLCEQVLADGNSVVYISNPEMYINGVLTYVGQEDRYLDDGLKIIRVPYVNLRLEAITKKIRAFKGVYSILERESPDVIFCHNSHYLPVLDVIKYKKGHPTVKLFADTHVTAENSASTWASKHILHGIYYKWLVKRLIPYLDKYFYVGMDEKDFAVETYGIPEELMEYYPLGGTIFSDEEYKGRREKARKELGLSFDELLFVHSGKLDKLKKTGDLLKAFSAVKNLNARLVIAGSIPNETEEEIETLMRGDERIEYIGWKNADELTDVLCACDLYCQPGSVSATMQNAICCNSAVLSYPHKTYEPLDFGQFIWTEDVQQMIVAFNIIAEGEINLDILKESAKKCATELLDYSKLAARIYE